MQLLTKLKFFAVQFVTNKILFKVSKLSSGYVSYISLLLKYRPAKALLQYLGKTLVWREGQVL